MDRYNLTSSVLVFLFLQSVVFAVVEDVVCKENYRFNGLVFNEFFSERMEYAQGEEVSFEYIINNRFGSPLVEGDIKVLMVYEGMEVANRLEDADIVDDFFGATGINLQTGDSYRGSFSWKIPEKAKPGVYAARLYFPVKEKFNVAGITFMSSVSAKVTSFRVNGTDYSVPMLDRKQTYLNGKAYGFRDYIPGFASGTPMELKTFLSAKTGDSISVLYELFPWEDMEKRMESYTRTEEVSGSKQLVYGISALPTGVYVARITASLDDWRSIMKVRFYVPGSKARFVWLGLDHFPLMDGDNATLAFCYSNSAVNPMNTSISFPVRLRLQVTGASGERLVDEEYSAKNVTSFIDSNIIRFVSPGRHTKLKIKAEAYDASGNLMDEAEIVYDYSKFLNIEKVIKLSAPTEADSQLPYSVTYTDKYGDNIAGGLFVYLSDASGRIVSTKETNFSGTYSASFSLSGLPEGSYTIKAVETDSSLSDSGSVAVKRGNAPVTSAQTTSTEVEVQTTIPGKENTPGLSFDLLLIILAVCALAALVIKIRHGKPKEVKK
jgi:hypothetical protein